MAQSNAAAVVSSVDAHFALIAFVIILCGVIGGIGNYCLPVESTTNRVSLVKTIIIGILASALVPLFLNMISSDLIWSSRTDALRLFVFAGFCLIAAISARAFILTISDKVLKEVAEKADDAQWKAEAADRKAEQADEKATAAVETVSDPEQPTDNVNRLDTEVMTLDAHDVALLRGLAEGKYKFRSIGGLANDSHLEPADLLGRLTKLVNQGFVRTFKSGSRTLWYITPEGKRAYQETKG